MRFGIDFGKVYHLPAREQSKPTVRSDLAAARSRQASKLFSSPSNSYEPNDFGFFSWNKNVGTPQEAGGLRQQIYDWQKFREGQSLRKYRHKEHYATWCFKHILFEHGRLADGMSAESHRVQIAAAG